MPQSVVVDVLAPVAVDTAYSYRAPLGLKLEPGAFVRMPLGARIATGVVWATRTSGGDNLKSIAEVLEWPPLRPALRDFIDWTARWTLAPRGMLLRMAIRAGEIAAPPAPKFGLVATGKAPNPARLYFQRAVAQLVTNNAAAAANDMAQAQKLVPTELYYVLWLHVARVQAGQSDADELAANARTLDQSQWPWPAVALFLGTSGPDAVQKAVAAAAPSARIGLACEADFFVGVYQMAKAAQDAAKPLFQSSVDHCPHDYFEYWGAAFELKQMNDLAAAQPK